MKKSVDYFRMLKLLSEYVSEIYLKALSGKDYSADRIGFKAVKSELIDSLQKDFITPLDRGDIFLLTENLCNELNAVFSVHEYYNLVNKKNCDELNIISDFLENQSNIFSHLKNYEGNIRLFEQCSEVIKKLNRAKKENEKRIVDILSCKREQPLINYVLFSAILDLNREIYKTFLEIERIIINS